MPAVPAQLPVNEPLRLAALRRYGILDTPAEAAFDDLAALAAFICGTPISVVSLIDADRQWFKAEVGLGISETSRDVAFCSHAILGSDVFVVDDALADSRFVDNPLVTGDPNIRFYAGAPMTTPDGYPLGTLCVIDRVPRTLTPDQSEALRALSRQAMAQIELRRRHAEAAAALTEAEALMTLKSQFVSMVSHELRTPLTSIRGGLQLALSDIDSTAMPETHELLSGALRSSERLIRMTSDILDASKVEAGKLELRRARQQIDSIIASALEGVAHLPGIRGCIDASIEPELPPVFVDADRIVQALVNLLSNAIKFSPPGQRVRVDARRAGDGIECRITDRGPGLAANEIAQLFQPFRQLDKGAKLGGTGLGLVITRHIVEQHGGSVSVESTPGAGATFIVWLPADADRSL